MEGSKPKKNKKTVIIISSIIAIILIVGGTIGYKVYKEKQYRKDIVATSYLMINLAADCERVDNNYISLWEGIIDSNDGWSRDYIATKIGVDRENFKANTTPLQVNDKAYGFNSVLKCYMEYNENTGVNKSLEDKIKLIDGQMKKLNNPGDKFKPAYDSLLKMYKALSMFESYSVNPQGSLVSYKEDISKLDNEIISNYHVFETQLPN